MRALTTVGLPRAAASGVLLAMVNPKAVFICAAVSLAAGTTGVGAAGTWTTITFFVVVAASSVARPIPSHGRRSVGAVQGNLRALTPRRASSAPPWVG
jgi:hypothetical protein